MKLIKNSLLFIPDETNSAGVDPLDTNVNDIDTSFPVLPATWYSFQIGECKTEPNKTQTGDNLVVPLKTTEKVQDIKGQDVNPGHTIKVYISLTETPTYDINSIKKGVARIAKAAGLNNTVREVIKNPSMLNGKILPRVKLKVNKETDEYPQSNGVAKFSED